ncbi:MAG: ATP-binding cassette domain-containing protein [Bacilli bacterium]
MNKNEPILKLKGVSKFYYNKGIVASGFSRISLEFNLGEFVIITGESGSGKSTLLNVLSGLDTYEEGQMYINGEETSHYSNEDIEHYRKTYVANIFQSFNLINSYTVYQNIELVLLLNGFNKKDIKERVIELIKKVDLYRYRNTKVSKLSGGQKQRVAIARALAKDTPIILADEPTGNLDTRSAQSVVKLLYEVAKDKLVIVVTHNYEQFEKYATRKIEMHDGLVREDIKIKEYENAKPCIYDYKNITFFNKIRLGIRNAFNIIPKFILLAMVFALLILAFLGTYSSFRKREYEESKNGFNYYFSDLTDTRIVIKKKDKTSFTEEDYKKISKLPYIEKIEKNDIILDSKYSLNNDEYYFYGTIKNINELDHVDVGSLPLKDTDVVIKKYKDDYPTDLNEVLNKKFNLYDENYYEKINDNYEFQVTGYVYYENLYGINSIYVSDEIFNKLKLNVNKNYSNLKIKINNQNTDLNIKISDNVPIGEAYLAYDYSYYCKYNYCINNIINLNVDNIYYSENIDLKITKTYTKYNFTSLTGFSDYEENNGYIYISREDFNKLYNKDYYQSSVFVTDVKHLDEVMSNLDNLGFDALSIKDVTVNYDDEILAMIKIFNIIISTIVFIVLFFIAYFVIRLIEKSRNVYYATIRFLGASKKVIKNLISIELYFIYHFVCLLILLIIYLVHNKILYINWINSLANYLTIKDYIIIYILMFVMSALISFRYSRKLFKSSAMTTYRQEV